MTHRTILITAGSIAAVVVVAAIAVGVNLRILAVADSSPVGQLTAATVARVSPVEPVQTQPAGTPAGAVKRRATQDYIIKDAGTVRIAHSKKAVRLVDAGARRHWAWKLAQTGDRRLTVTFTRGSSIYTFAAGVDVRGKLSATVSHPVTRLAASSAGSPAPAPAPAVTQPVTAGSLSGGGEGGSSGHDQDD